MKTDTHGNGHGLNDLYILPENDDEQERIFDFLLEKKQKWSFSYSNVKGHTWHGKRFIVVDFAECLLDDLEQCIQTSRTR